MIALETLQFSNANAKLEALYNVPELESWLADGRKVVLLLDLLIFSGDLIFKGFDCLLKTINILGWEVKETPNNIYLRHCKAVDDLKI